MDDYEKKCEGFLDSLDETIYLFKIFRESYFRFKGYRNNLALEQVEKKLEYAEFLANTIDYRFDDPFDEIRDMEEKQ